MSFLYLPAKLLELVFLAVSVSLLLFGSFQVLAGVYYLVRGEAVEGEVTFVESGEVAPRTFRSIGEAEGSVSPARWPTIAYASPGDGSLHTIQSLVPRDDLEKGDKVTVRVLPGSPGSGRADLPFGRHLLHLGLAGFGVVMTTVIALLWYQVDLLFGRPIPGATTSIFTGWLPFVGLAATLTPALVVYAVFGAHAPWLAIHELPLAVAGDRLGIMMELAAERGGPPGDGPLNAYEARLLEFPWLARGWADEAFHTALRGRANAARLERYVRAVEDPDVTFPIDLGSFGEDFVRDGRNPEVLERLLAAGVEVAPAQRDHWRELGEIRRKRQRDEIAPILERYGLLDAAPSDRRQ